MPPARYDVQITQGAEYDLEATYFYMAEHRSVAEAEQFLDDLIAKVETLERFPKRGHVPPELAPLGIASVREIGFKKYRIIYRIEEKRVFVMVIADGRRDLQALLERRLLTAPGGA